MKKILFYILPLLAILAVVSCSDDDEKVAKNATLSITLKFPEGYTSADLSETSVKVTNTQTSQTYDATKGDNDKYSVVVPSGEYQISISGQLPGHISLNGLTNVSVYADTEATVTLSKGNFSGLIFKEIYYSKVKKNGKTPYNDEFYELYNNSDEVVYLDNVIFGVLEGTQGILPSGWMEKHGIFQMMHKNQHVKIKKRIGHKLF